MAITNNVGSLKIQITNNNFFPVEGASVYISPTGMPDSTSEEFVTDENGIVIDEELPAPDVTYSLEPGDNQPYSGYNVGTLPGTTSASSPGFRYSPVRTGSRT